MLIENGDLTEAETTLKQYLNNTPGDTAVSQQLASVYGEMGRHEQVRYTNWSPGGAAVCNTVHYEYDRIYMGFHTEQTLVKHIIKIGVRNTHK